MRQDFQHSLSEEVLEKTMDLFWEKGYFNTSIEDITLITGFNRTALYKYYGGKENLFYEILVRFRKNVTDKISMPLQSKVNGLEGILTFFTQFIELYDQAGLKGRGCLLVSTASDIQA